jgi:predicted membrane channel-forming protein YqfA (hemolysin III family)
MNPTTLLHLLSKIRLRGATSPLSRISSGRSALLTTGTTVPFCFQQYYDHDEGDITMMIMMVMISNFDPSVCYIFIKI